MLPKKVYNIVKDREFISVATCDFNGRPNAAPKIVLKIEGSYLYLVDYTIGTTYRNLTINPRASLSMMNPDTLTGYQINGAVEIIEKGKVYEKLCAEMEEKTIKLTAKHIIEKVRGQGKSEKFEAAITDRFIVFKVKMEELVSIGPGRVLERGKV